MEVCFGANPKDVFAKDAYGFTPIHYLCKYNAPNLAKMHFLKAHAAKGCFEVCDYDQDDDDWTHGNVNGNANAIATPLHMLIQNGTIGYLPLTVAICHGIVWLHPIIEANLERDGQILIRKDEETGLFLFMLAAVGEEAHLSSIFTLLCASPGLVAVAD
jgi:hypothetical protein